MNSGKLLLIPAAIFAVAVLFCPRPATAQSGNDIEIQVDCGPNASYNQEYKVCFCDDGYQASDDGVTCVKDETPGKKEAPAVKDEEPPEKPKKAEPEAAPKEAAVSAPPPAPRRRELQPGEILLRRGTTIKLQLMETVSSQTHKSGEAINFKVVDEVDMDGYAVIDEGSEALGKVTYSKPAKGWGKSGQLDISLESAKAVDETLVPLTAYMTDSKDWDPYAAGKTLASAIIAGPLGLTIGGGMKGKKVVIDKGTTLAVFVAEDVIIKSDKPASVKKPLAPTSAASGSAAAPPASAEEQAQKVLKGCFEACKDSEGDTFKACMNTCRTDCPDLCLGLDGADFTTCLKKCAVP